MKLYFGNMVTTVCKAVSIIMHLGTDFVHVGCLYIDNETINDRVIMVVNHLKCIWRLADMEERGGVLVENGKAGE